MTRTVQSRKEPFEFRLDSASGVPVYRQLIDQVTGGIASGMLSAGEQLPTVRQVAVDLAINPNTVVRAYRELEIRGLLETQQGTGTFISHKKIERAWKAKCSSCHGQAGKGDTEKGQQMKIADMTTAEFQAKKDDELKNAILNGVKKEKGGVKQEMDAFKGDLTPEQVDALVAYIRTFKK